MSDCCTPNSGFCWVCAILTAALLPGWVCAIVLIVRTVLNV